MMSKDRAVVAVAPGIDVVVYANWEKPPTVAQEIPDHSKVRRILHIADLALTAHYRNSMGTSCGVCPYLRKFCKA